MKKARLRTYKKDRCVFKIEITQESRKTIERISVDLGMTQICVASRLVTWFAAQPSEIKAAVLGFYPSLISKDVTVQILENMKCGTV